MVLQIPSLVLRFISWLWFVLLSGLCCFFVLDSRRRDWGVPWAFLIAAIGIAARVLGLGRIVVNVDFWYEVSFKPFWLLLGWFIYVQRRSLRAFFIKRQGLARSLALGALLGLGSGSVFAVTALFRTEVVTGGIERQASTWAILIHVVETAIFEELLFRSFLLGYLKRHELPYWRANVIQGFLFVLAHGSYWISGDWVGLACVGIFGLLSGRLIWKQENIAGAVLAHSLANLLPGVIVIKA